MTQPANETPGSPRARGPTGPAGPAPGRPGVALAAVVATALLLAAPGAGRAQTTDQLKREVAAIGVTEKLGAAVPRDAAFTEASGARLTLASLAGRPLLLSFNYTGCPRLCGLQLSGLARALRERGWMGDGFQVVTISIDPAEKLPQLAAYKQAKIREAGARPGVAEGWHFLTGREADVAALAEAVGFRYRYEPSTGEYQHQATLVVVGGDGRVSGYLHGISYPAAPLDEALARAGRNQVATLAQQQGLGGFLLSCMGYDPADHSPLALLVMRGGGLVALLFLVSLLGYLALRGAQRRRLHGRTP
jgi:protein SCO1